MSLLNRRDFEKLALASLVASVSGCGEFYKTDGIRKTAEDIIDGREEFGNEIVDSRRMFLDKIIESKEQLVSEAKKEKDRLIDEYLESGTEELPHLPRNNEALVSVIGDGSYTVTYEAEFISSASIKAALEEQLNGPASKEPKAKVSNPPNTQQLIITTRDQYDLNRLEVILGSIDKLPSQTLLKFKATADFGDKAQEYATRLYMELRTNRGDLGIITDEAKFPGAAERVRTTADIGAILGGQIDTSLFDVKAMIKTLETWGYSKNIFETYILLSDGREGSLSGEEKLPIPEQVLQGLNSVVTQKMESIKSDFKGTATKRNKMVELTATVGVGNAKRPDIKRPDFLVPARDEVVIQSIYLPIGIPYIIGGKLMEMEIGIHRKDPLLPWFSSDKDFEKRRTRIRYEVTAYKVADWTNPPNIQLRYEVVKPIVIPQRPTA
jgi:hypothetical protein